MTAPARSAHDPLRIVHVLRAPVGGVLRHVCDLARAQSAAGHAVGVICDSLTGGPFEADTIADVVRDLALGATRLPMRRGVSPADLPALVAVTRRAAALDPDVIHCHGAKGGFYGRLVAAWIGRRALNTRRRPLACLYAPHGGSLHYDAASLEGRVYFGIERGLERVTDTLLHVSAYEAATYREKVGPPRCEVAVVPNGLRDEEFEPVRPDADARDLLFLGTYRELKGVDVFLEALARLDTRHGRRASAVLYGQIEGDDIDRFRALATSLGLDDRASFHGPVPARQAFAQARAIVVPSRAESMPYVVLEAIAAGLPIVATNVGGIPEIFGPRAAELVPPGDADALAGALARLLADPDAARRDAAERLAWMKPRFHIETMQRRIEDIYREILTRKSA